MRYRGRIMNWLRWAILVLVALALAGCPKQKRRTLVPDVPTSGDTSARTRFIAARDAFLRDGGQVEEFEAIAAEFEGDPVEPFALLYAGIAAQQAGEAAGAVQSLEKLLAIDGIEPGLRARGELYLGLARGTLGDAEGALPLLEKSEAAVENEAERGAWLAALVHAHLGGPTPLRALPWMERWWKDATPPERAYLYGRGEEVVAAAGDAEIAAAWAEARGDVAAALLGERIARDRAAAGDANGAQEAQRRVASARRALGLPGGDAADVPSGPVAIGRLGAIVAQSARHARIGEQIVKGLHVAAASLGERAPAIQIEDAEGAAAGEAVAVLAGQEVAAIVGPADGASVDAATARAIELRVPLLSLNPRAEERPAGGAWVFHVMHSAEARARMLARRAVAAGVRRFAVLRPENGYGNAVAQAFRDEVAAQGGEIVVDVGYKPDTKSFAGIAKKLSGSWQGVFVPDTADRVELVAPALAAAGFQARAPGTKKATGGRPVLLLSTVEGAGDGYVREAARYSEGAFLAPGFFPGAIDERGLDFERAYLAATGKAPTAVDAYAYDAVRAIAAVVADGARDRGALAQRMAAARIDGVTGALRFDAAHRRADDGVVYTVEVQGGSPVVKALR